MTEQEILAIYTRVYAMTGDITVTFFDCGTLCAKRCCRTFACAGASAEDQDYGMELYPGEELILAGEIKSRRWLDWRFLSGREYHLPSFWGPDEGVYFVGCKIPCPRDKRPLRCRLFPYKPVLRPNGKVVLVLEQGAPNYCPLTGDDLDPRARNKLEKAMQLLITVPKVRELLWWDAQP